MVKLNLKEIVAFKPRRAGFTMTGSPTNINVGRTMRNTYGRRIALRAAEAAGDGRDCGRARNARARAGSPDAAARQRMLSLREELEALERRRRVIAYVDPVDIRFNRFDPQPLPNTSAVMFCLMDVSGSMGEREKDLAKRFFVLLHLFLKRRYDRTDIVFIRHTHEAQEVDEETFFYSTQSGGTVVSTALEEMRRIIEERYPSREWNIYAAQASDGDNVASDSERCISLLNEQAYAALPVFRLCRNHRRARKPHLRDHRQRHDAVAFLSHDCCELAEFSDEPHRQAERDLSGLPQALRQAAGFTEGRLRHATTRGQVTFAVCRFRLELRHALPRL